MSTLAPADYSTGNPSPDPTEQIEKFVRNKKKDQELLVKLNKWASDCRKNRLNFEKEWYTNLAFFFGKQWVTWVSTNTEFQRLIEPPAPSWRVRLTSNKIKPTIRKELSKITQERPRGFVIPSSSDDEDLAAARAAEAALDHMIRECKLDEVEIQAIWWTVLTGTGFIKDWWDTTVSDSNGVKGDVKAEKVTPFHLLVPDLEEEDLDNQPYLIHTMAKEVSWVKKVYGKDVPPDTNNQGGVLESKFLSAMGIQQDSSKAHVAIHEAWIKPCDDFKQGAVVTWAKDEILNVTEGAFYGHNEYPFTKITHIPTGRFYGQSVIVDLIPLQKEYNRSRSQIIESKNRMSKPQLLAPNGSVNPRKITSEPGLVIFYRPGFNPPTPLPLQNIPAYVLQDLDRTQQDINDISSQHEVSHGGAPPGVEAATAIAYLQEQDDTVLSLTIRSLERAHERVGRHLLSHAGTYWDAERTVKIMGKENWFESFVFKKSDLRGNTDFRVVSGSAAPVSRAAKQAHIMEMVKSGMIPPDRGLQFLDMAETSRIYEEMQIDVRQAQRENLKMSQGIPCPCNLYDSHQAHITEHWGYMKRQEFENSDEQIKLIFQEHVVTHMLALANEYGLQFLPEDPQLIGFTKNILQGGGMPIQNGGQPEPAAAGAPAS